MFYQEVIICSSDCRSLAAPSRILEWNRDSDKKVFCFFSPEKKAF